MASIQDSKYTLYLLILVVAIILIIGLLSVGGTSETPQQVSKPTQTVAQGQTEDSAVATVSFMILPPDGGGE